MSDNRSPSIRLSGSGDRRGTSAKQRASHAPTSIPRTTHEKERHAPPLTYLTPSEILVIEKHYDRCRTAIRDPGVISALLIGLGQALTEGQKAILLAEAGYDGHGLFTLEQLMHIMASLKKNFMTATSRFSAPSDIDTLEAFVSLGGSPDESGDVSVEQLKAVVTDFRLAVDVESLVKMIDDDASGMLNFQEFRSLFTKMEKKATITKQASIQYDKVLLRQTAPTVLNPEELLSGQDSAEDFGNSPSLFSPLVENNNDNYVAEMEGILQKLNRVAAPRQDSVVEGMLAHPVRIPMRPPPPELHTTRFFQRRPVTPPADTQVEKISRKLDKSEDVVRKGRLRITADIAALRAQSERLHREEMNVLIDVQALVVAKRDKLWQEQVAASQAKLRTSTKIENQKKMRPKTAL